MGEGVDGDLAPGVERREAEETVGGAEAVHVVVATHHHECLQWIGMWKKCSKCSTCSTGSKLR